jgi:hypothetical protein
MANANIDDLYFRYVAFSMKETASNQLTVAARSHEFDIVQGLQHGGSS